MSEPGLASTAAIRRARDCIEQWILEHLDPGGGFGLVAASRDEETSRRYYLRLRGEERAFATCWLLIDQRTLRHETQFMPAPIENHEGVYAYLLSLNASMYQMSFAIGHEEGIYLAGKIPIARVDEHEIDRIVGTTLSLIETHFPTAMSLGYGDRFVRRVAQQSGEDAAH